MLLNNMYNTGVSQGTAHKNNLQTTRIINWNDNFYDKLDEFTTDANYFWQIDKNRKLNLYTSLGIDKTYYEINSDINVIESRIINWNDNFYDKLDEFTTDANYFWQIDKNRKLNLYTSLGIDKTYYEINSDINVNKTLSTTSSGEIYNYIVAKNTYTDDSGVRA